MVTVLQYDRLLAEETLLMLQEAGKHCAQTTLIEDVRCM